jgi:prepilin peptidase CpaA
MPGIFLFLATIDDLYTRKVHNKLLLLFLALTFLYLSFIYENPIGQWRSGLLALLAVTVLTLPFAYFRILGAGDMKLLMVVSLFLNPAEVLSLLYFTLLWAGLFIIILSLSKWGLGIISSRVLQFFYLKNFQVDNKHTIPFTVPIFFAWLTFISQSGNLYIASLT